MSMYTSGDNNGQLLAAALSAILGKEILTESSVPTHSQQHRSKVSLFDQHLTSFVYTNVDDHGSSGNQSLITLNVTILATKTTHPFVIEREASVDQLKLMIYNKEGIPCNKQNLIYCGQEIDEGHLLSEYGIGDGSVINVVRLRAINSNDLLVLDDDSRDPMYDYDFTNIDDRGKTFHRGGVEYRRPCGCLRFAIKVAGKYENETWLGSSNGRNEWPVSYHGTKLDAVNSIAPNGYDLAKHNRFIHGRGVYSTPDINVARGFAKSFTHENQEYLVILQNRVNPKNVMKLSTEETGNGEYWISPTAADIRPYGVCIMKK